MKNDLLVTEEKVEFHGILLCGKILCYRTSSEKIVYINDEPQ